MVVAGDPAARVQLLVRCQRWLDRRNAASSGAWFDAVLRDHARLHDRSLPLVRADHNHALDTWQWTLRLDPGASAAVQLAALFHDVERLESEAEKRIEHHAADHAAFKRAHAAGSAAWLERLVAGTSAARFALRAAALIAAGDQVRGAGGATAELQLLEDADSLSFFSLNSGGFLDYYGPDHTVRKIRWTLARMSARAHAALAGVHLRHDVAALRGAIPGR